MKFSRTVYNDEISVPYEYAIDRVNRTKNLAQKKPGAEGGFYLGQSSNIGGGGAGGVLWNQV